MQRVWKHAKHDLEITTGIIDAPVLSADQIKSSRIFSSLDTHVLMLQRMVDHDATVDRRAHQREELRQQAADGGDPQALNRRYPELVEDVVKDTKASKFTIAPIGQDEGEMHMYGAPLDREGLLRILRFLGKLPREIDRGADHHTQLRQFTTRIAAREMARWISPIREGQQQPANPSLVVGAYCEVNPVTTSFIKVPPAALDAANQRELRRNAAAPNQSASYKRWLERQAMQSTLTPEQLWLDGVIIQPHPNALEREHFLSPRDFEANPEEAARQRTMFDHLLYEPFVIDPGIRNPVTTVRLRDGLVHSMTLEQYYCHAKIDERIRKMTGWLRRDEDVVAFRAARGVLTFKTTSAAEHDSLLRVFVEHITTIRYVAELDAPVVQPLGFDSVGSATTRPVGSATTRSTLTRPRSRSLARDRLWYSIGLKRARQDFNVHIHSEKTISKYWAELFTLSGGKPPMCFYGDGVFGCGSQFGLRPQPISKWAEKCFEMIPSWWVQEKFSTSGCGNCGGKLQDFVVNEPPQRRSKKREIAAGRYGGY
ncbi:MAG: hypothetical protein K0U52_11470 [Gammaproteobacteria bacterium]|nr:hypothetical protein [Gammaproteobacteria bacterium]